MVAIRIKVNTKIAREMDPIFKARSVAVIGASNDPTKWGYSVMERLIKGGYKGSIFPVNPRETAILGVTAYPNIREVPTQVDLATFAIPGPLVPEAMKEAISAGVRGAMVISAGFAESGPEGEKLQQQLLQIIQNSNIRMIGPNCNGMWSSYVGLSLSSTEPMSHGSIAFISQSGAFGGMLVRQAEEKGYGLSKFVSSGNQADLNEADYLEYLGQDDNTKVIALYLEGFQDGKRFTDVAKKVVAKKPIVIYKAGRNSVGARVVRSHTGSMMLPDNLFDALCKQIGLIGASETGHLFDMAEALANAPLPKSSGVGIISMTGGQCVVSSDTCAHLGLPVPELDIKTQQYIKTEFLAPHAPMPRNPVDIAGDFRSPLIFAELAETMAELDYIGVLLITPPSSRGDSSSALSEEAAKRIARIPTEYGKPVIALGQIHTKDNADSRVSQILRNARMSGYQRPEDAARAAYALIRYSQVKSISLK